MKLKARMIFKDWPRGRSTLNTAGLRFGAIGLAWMAKMFPVPADLNTRDKERLLNMAYHDEQHRMVEIYREAWRRAPAYIHQPRIRLLTICPTKEKVKTWPIFAHSDWPMGMELIQHMACPIGAINPMACWFCHFGHATECHYPFSCSDVKCSHYQREIQGVNMYSRKWKWPGLTREAKMRGAISAMQIIMDTRKGFYSSNRAWHTLTHAAQHLIDEFDERQETKKPGSSRRAYGRNSR